MTAARPSSATPAAPDGATGDGALDRLLRPRSIAVVGAAPMGSGKMGTRTLYDLVHSGWTGRLYPVTSSHAEIYGHPCHASVRDLPEAPDVVLVRAPAAAVEGILEDCVARGAGVVIVLASGFSESGEEGEAAQRRVLDLLKDSGTRMLGPQSIGVFNFVDDVPISLSALLGRTTPRPGPVAILTQSGAMANTLACAFTDRGIGLSYYVTFGNSADVTPDEMLDHLVDDPHTQVAALYLEGVADGRALMNAARRFTAAGKRLVVLRSGTSEQGARAVRSHTASLAGDGAVFSAALASCGAVEVPTLRDMVDAVDAARACQGLGEGRLGLVSFSGATCALFADACARHGLPLAPLDDATATSLRKVLPPFLSPGLPLDLGPAVFDTAAFEASVEALLDAPGLDGLVVFLSTINAELMAPVDKARFLIAAAARAAKPIAVVWPAGTSEELDILRGSPDLPLFTDIDDAIGALARLHRADRLVDAARTAGAWVLPLERTTGPSAGALVTLAECEGKDRLADAGLPLPGRALLTVDGMGSMPDLRPPFAVKVQSRDILHKSDCGGLRLAVASADEARHAAREIATAVAGSRPEASLLGVLVEEMVPPPAVELLMTVGRDAAFGPVLTVGLGGIFVELLRDVRQVVLPASVAEIEAALRALSGAAILDGARGGPAYDVTAAAELAARLGRMMIAAPDVVEVELNPVFLRPRGQGVVVADCLMTLAGEAV